MRGWTLRDAEYTFRVLPRISVSSAFSKSLSEGLNFAIPPFQKSYLFNAMCHKSVT